MQARIILLLRQLKHTLDWHAGKYSLVAGKLDRRGYRGILGVHQGASQSGAGQDTSFWGKHLTQKYAPNSMENNGDLVFKN